MNCRVTGIIWVGSISHKGGYENVSGNFPKGLEKIGFATIQEFSCKRDTRELDSKSLNVSNVRLSRQKHEVDQSVESLAF